MSRCHAKLRFLTQLLATAIMFVAATAFAKHFADLGHMPHWKTIVLAAIPTAFIVRMVAIYAIYLKEEKDEFQRELFIKSLLWGTGAILSITTFWTFLNIFAHVRPFQAFDVLLIFSIAFAIATITQNLYHRRGSGE